ncbi:ClpP/crotonase-like domain-containing protein [Mycotypha africana]|uniref:ClpP/crotonase-like domain-containing protein n=1 Tax=Mycotypha africana TaxID=64632 RepID=UPI00230099FC|nr:ClpP/crotonase-like domain-containing protein [Mycotypha africana]KAI8988342.1 ClpP/crotonase-like domain-containing protein [Mycotypha africana]
MHILMRGKQVGLFSFSSPHFTVVLYLLTYKIDRIKKKHIMSIHSTVPQLETMEIVLFPNGVAEIAHNRPKRSNALSPQSYRDWLNALRWAAQSDRVKIVILTGRGRYYTSGQQLEMPDASIQNLEEEMDQRRQTTTDVVSEMIKFPKLIIAAVNGPSIGFGTTTLALCDVVYSVPEATFSTPFMKLGFCAEGCSSILLPRIMGQSKANEMLLLGRTFNAQEMVDCGFISRILPAQGFREAILRIADDASKFSSEAIKVTKDLVRNIDRDLLEQVNQNEMSALKDRMNSSDSLESIMRFLEEAAAKKAAKAKAKL